MGAKTYKTEADVDLEAVQPNGLPVQWADGGFGGPNQAHLTGLYLTIFETALGVGVAYGIYYIGPMESYDAKMALVRTGDLGVLYLVPTIMTFFLMFGMFYSTKWRAASPVNVPNQFIYKMANSNQPYVLMEEDGNAGKFNRSQRAVANILEYMPLVLAQTILACYVFPYPTIILLGIYVVLRLQYIVKYVDSPKYTNSHCPFYPSRIPGFVISQHIISPCIQGLCLITAIKTLS